MNDLNLFFLLVMSFPILLLFVLIGLKTQGAWLRSSKTGLVIWNAVFLLFLTSTIFLAGETYYRFFVDTTDSFALNKTTRRWAMRHYEKNNMGVRDNVDYNYLIGSGKRRLTIIGDSFTAGHGVKDVNDRFGNLLKVRFPNTEVHVLGTNGFETIDELERFRKILSEGYEPDFVMLTYCLNDISYLIPEAQEVYREMAEFDRNLNYIERESYLVNTLVFRIMANRNPNVTNYYAFLKDRYSGETWKQQKSVLKQLKALVEENGGHLVVATIPFLHQLEDYQFQSVHDSLVLFWHDSEVPYLNLLPVFESESSESVVVNRFDAHPNEHAHRIIADALEPFIRSQFKSTPK
ncbi:MAG: hypothetical protein GC178_01745 [Flavobacteriales bacterium]|nr:hypothetical protein [Flavobacteriales bacterium]